MTGRSAADNRLISAREKACPAQKCCPVPNAMFT
jgi:hypothetical protein